MAKTKTKPARRDLPVKPKKLTRKQVEAVYVRMHPLLAGLVRAFVRRVGVRFAKRMGEEYEGRIGLYFMEAVKGFDPRRGGLESRVVYVLKQSVIEDLNAERERASRAATADEVPADWTPDCLPIRVESVFDEDRLWDLMPEDSQVAAELVVHGGLTTSGEVRSALLADGWSSFRIREAYRGVCRALGGRGWDDED